MLVVLEPFGAFLPGVGDAAFVGDEHGTLVGVD